MPVIIAIICLLIWEQNLDSADHQSHVAYMTGLDNGACPDTHPVGLMHLMYEVCLIISFYEAVRL